MAKVRFTLKGKHPLMPWCDVHESNTGCKVMVGIENGEWHLSISHKKRYPTWDEIKAARYAFMPENMYVGMVLPPKGEYVNIHENCFHLHEMPDWKG